MTDGLKDKHHKAIVDVLRANERVERAVLFGSRAMGTFTNTSDVDIALFGNQLTLNDQSKLAVEIDELSIPQQVDLVLYKSIKSKELLGHIRKHGVEWFGRSWATGSEWQQTTIGHLLTNRAIAHILSSLDDKIELNQQMNQTLEKMVQSIFKSWFVDFDPVRAKVEGRDTGLPKEIADLFPDSFVDSELGEIPKGWEVIPEGSVIEKFELITKGLLGQVKENRAQSDTLIKLRDTILPKLESGELVPVSNL